MSISRLVTVMYQFDCFRVVPNTICTAETARVVDIQIHVAFRRITSRLDLSLSSTVCDRWGKRVT